MKLGIDRIDELMHIFEGKRVGLITNPTGLDSTYRSTIKVLNEKVNLVALFSPEHGVRGNVQAGEKLAAYTDEETGCIVHSLYGDTRRPTAEMMKDIDVLCIDLQDVGSRFYTYIYTMAYSMMASKEFDKEFVVFDRPNPINGVDIEGNILDLKYRSFVGYYPILQRHGMTLAELASLFNTEYEIGCKLHLVLMDGWNREMYFEDTNKIWVSPSPNIPTPTSTIVYNCTCIFEGTNLSEGRGTTLPFQLVGAPWVDPYDLAEKMNAFGFNGVHFRPLFFTPTFSKHAKEMCGGVELHIIDRKSFKPVKVGWALLETIRTMYPDNFEVLKPWVEGRPCMLEYETGGSFIKDRLYSLEEQFEILEKDTKEFEITRRKYLLY